MSMQGLFLYNAAALILIGIFGILTRRNIIKILLAINILRLRIRTGRPENDHSDQ